MAELLGAAARLKVLVTSRSVLRVYGEHELSVPPLALPDRRATPSAAHLAQFEAVHLFVERAQAARPDFALTDENAPAVAEICQRLDGLPLAIELAAARVRALPPRAMLQRLERRLPLLTGGARDLPARQQTLRDAIAWSYDLLEPDEQALFRRLAVFRGCTLEAAETVCAGDPPRPGATSVALPPLDLDVLDGIESLVEKSLLRQDEAADGQPWYRMLETVREYALERLEESGEANAVHRRHVLAALRLAEAVRAGAVRRRADGLARAAGAGARQPARGASLVPRAGYAEPALRLGVALWWFWSTCGHISEGQEHLTSILERFPIRGSGSRAELYARALYAAGMLASWQGNHSMARARHEEGLALRRAAGDPSGVFTALEGLGTVTCLQGDYVAARRYLEEALAIARTLNERLPYGSVLNTLGNVSYELGDLDVARAYYQESLASYDYDESVDPRYRTLNGAMISVAAVVLDQGAYDEAQALASEALLGSEQDRQLAPGCRGTWHSWRHRTGTW